MIGVSGRICAGDLVIGVSFEHEGRIGLVTKVEEEVAHVDILPAGQELRFLATLAGCKRGDVVSLPVGDHDVLLKKEAIERLYFGEIEEVES